MKLSRLLKRRSFFKRAGMGAFGMAVISSIPFSSYIFKEKKSVQVKIHPNAVSRKK